MVRFTSNKTVIWRCVGNVNFFFGRLVREKNSKNQRAATRFAQSIVQRIKVRLQVHQRFRAATVGAARLESTGLEKLAKPAPSQATVSSGFLRHQCAATNQSREHLW